MELHGSSFSGLALATDGKWHKSHRQPSGILPPILLPYFKAVVFSLGLKMLWVWNIPQADRVPAGRPGCREPLRCNANVPCVDRDQLKHEKKKNEGQKRQRAWVKVNTTAAASGLIGNFFLPF